MESPLRGGLRAEEDVIFLLESAADADGGDTFDGLERAFDLESAMRRRRRRPCSPA
jgi:hypothetical protein